MKTKKISIELKECHSASELDNTHRKLISLAAEAARSAYAPYSAFKVGAAVLLKNGKTILGSNQENAAYPSGLCAERVALFAACSQFPKTKIAAVAINYISPASPGRKMKRGVKGEVITPCGSCRQVIAEYEKKQNAKIRILMNSPAGKVLIAHGIENLLPLVFNH